MCVPKGRSTILWRCGHHGSLTHLPDTVHLFHGSGQGLLEFCDSTLREVQSSQDLGGDTFDLLRIQLAGCETCIRDLLENFLDPFNKFALSRRL